MTATTNYVYIRQSQTDKYDWRYAFKQPGHENVYQIGRVLASSEPDAERKIWHKTTPIGRCVCITPIIKDINR